MVSWAKNIGLCTGQLGKKTYTVYRKLLKDKFLYLIFGIGFAQILIFKFYPLTWLTMAFKDYKVLKGLAGSPWVGFDHFIDFFTSPDILTLFYNTFAINILSLILGFPAPIILALLLNELSNGKVKKTVQTISYLPHFLSVVIVVTFVVDFFAAKGLMNSLRAFLGLEQIFFMGNPKYFRIIYVLSGIWQEVGWGSIIYLATLSGIDQQLYEAAVVDGAGKLQQMKYITWPGIYETIAIMLILRVGSLINLGFEKIYLLSNSATTSVSSIVSTYVYLKGITQGNYGFATAAGVFNSAISFVLVYSANAISRRLSGNSLW